MFKPLTVDELHASLGCPSGCLPKICRPIQSTGMWGGAWTSLRKRPQGVWGRIYKPAGWAVAPLGKLMVRRLAGAWDQLGPSPVWGTDKPFQSSPYYYGLFDAKLQKHEDEIKAIWCKFDKFVIYNFQTNRFLYTDTGLIVFNIE